MAVSPSHKFSLINTEDEEMCCITGHIGEDREPPERMIEAFHTLYKQPTPVLMMTVRNAAGQVTEAHAIAGD